LRTVPHSSARFDENAIFRLRPFEKRRCYVISSEWTRTFRIGRLAAVTVLISGKGLRSRFFATVALVKKETEARRL
jgi:hypothetical protein